MWRNSLAAVFGCSGLKLTSSEIDFFEASKPFGFILFSRNIKNPKQVRELIEQLRSCVGWRAPVLIDQEGGRVQRLVHPHWRLAPAMDKFGQLFLVDPEQALQAIRMNMQAIGTELFELGIDINCAPVLDIPVMGAHNVIGNRAIGPETWVVSQMAEAACQGLIDLGIIPVIKHLPGHGRATVDSHEELPVVAATERDITDRDCQPFQKVAKMPVAGMTAHVVYTSLDPENPATLSSKIIKSIIRKRIGFSGLLLSDDLGMKSLTGSFTNRAIQSLKAGCDIVLHCSANLLEMEQVVAGANILSNRAVAAFERLDSYRGKPTLSVDKEEVALRVASLLKPIA